MSVLDVPGVETFFRHCPACGRRFEIRLVSKEMVDDEGELEEPKELPPVGVISWRRSPGAILSTDTVNVLPELREREEIRYDYKCKHCGHEWSETRMRTTREKTPPDYTGD
jgi:peptide subunit release factor 1 (eRF1)